MSLVPRIIEMTMMGVPDAEIAKRCKCHQAYVRAARQRRGIFVGGLTKKQMLERRIKALEMELTTLRKLQQKPVQRRAA